MNVININNAKTKQTQKKTKNPSKYRDLKKNETENKQTNNKNPTENLESENIFFLNPQNSNWKNNGGAGMKKQKQKQTKNEMK